MKELVVISGKGGTGKTSITASLAALAGNAVFADCDVDAADLHIILEPHIIRQEPFIGGKVANVIEEECNGCGKCQELCRSDAVVTIEAECNANVPVARIDETACIGCGVCAWFCPSKAIRMEKSLQGEWYVSETRQGTMVHARLNPGGENSGKLVTTVRSKAQELAVKEGADFLITDGPPGIGCPVIASITGADLALVVTEPTLSGKHDLKRIMQLTAQMFIPTVVCINKRDINLEISDLIEAQVKTSGQCVVGKIDYDPAVSEAQFLKQSVVEYSEGIAADQIREMWQLLTEKLTSENAVSAQRQHS